MDILNKTTKAIRIPLSGGKRLFLGPGGLGQISPKAAEEPAVKALLDDGSIEIKGGMSSKPKSAKGRTQHGGKGGPAPGDGSLRHTGDR
ncbi:MAG: hypothetical protein ACJAZN_000486 [Planctomycetota bacterium]|jgi:hypothetical protein